MGEANLVLDTDVKEALISAREEIRSLRRRNELLSAKMDMVELFACVLHTRPATSTVGASVDVAWQIDRLLARTDG